ncbi:DUF4232 domain-containing protein [uncultured Rothia sp.]|uniref:DUF4232 domain-containing protein n=1 Tax=uncultured Rothia sp. TaxID=316088 RepID=UPI0032176BEB
MLTRLSPRFSLTAIACAALLALSACDSTQDESTSADSTIVASTSGSPTASPSPSSFAPTPSSTSASPTAPPLPTVTDTATASAAPIEPPRGSITTITEEALPSPTAVSPSAIPSASAEPTAAEPMQTATCDYGQIHIAAEVAPGGGAAGSRYIHLTFTNSGSSPCSLSGYPAVNYVDSQGNQIGAAARQAAEWTSSGAILAPGESAQATLRETKAALYDAESCHSTQAAGYRVSIPGTSSSLVLNFPAEACSSTETSQLSVGQIGAGPN